MIRSRPSVLLDSVGEGWVDLHRRHPAFFEGPVHEPVSILRVNFPEPTFPWLILLTGHLDEALVQGQVVPDGILSQKGKQQS